LLYPGNRKPSGGPQGLVSKQGRKEKRNARHSYKKKKTVKESPGNAPRQLKNTGKNQKLLGVRDPKQLKDGKKTTLYE